ncbi:peptide-N-glycosidase F-related protein [Taibaiella chishuiensis]|uniref:Putative secreted protein (Por secretion system target) n=1 Tax=Taibaiella chishuiensis TaxID=1434707 RepID=A0A2P8DCM8_9BACT|nr:peptide-N-glycosidase F-related protein [Taibaiella chishuiensis]PSK94978.1 putative secreted protein (Por secretion system target) [Taibaiella chishuiensis]
MKKALLLLTAALCTWTGQQALAQTKITVFDKILFYDGYAATVTEPVPANVIRHRNDLYARKLTDQELQSIGDNLIMRVIVKASCDNYDRIGNVNLALVPKGATTYTPSQVSRIEIGRYITPFMNKNKQPDTVPYQYNIGNVAHLLKESSITANYDIWAELELFGVPYAANNEVPGCAGRNDVFFGTLEFETSGNMPVENNNVLIPLNFKKNLNNYDSTATDTVGKTTRTINFNVASNLTDATLFLITSNHGANANGEEYNRRDHFIYFDGVQKLTYKPGSTSCEPFRKYNTQGNGIYGANPRSDATWQSFSNWCPGDVIPIRTINLGPVAAGSHSFGIRVPSAVFANGEGYFPISVYLQGKTQGVLGVKETPNTTINAQLFPNPTNGVLTITAEERVQRITVFNVLGQQVMTADNTDKIDLSSLEAGVYWTRILFKNEATLVRKVVRN